MSFVGSYVREHLKAQSAVVPVLKHLRRGGHGYKSFPKHAGRAWNQTQDYITGARSYCKINRKIHKYKANFKKEKVS